MNLYRWVKGLGLIPRVMGNVKGLQDPYRNPTTQQGWAERWGQNAAMVTSFADGSKISFEQSIVANATGFKVRSRGMSRGVKYEGSINDIHKLYDLEELRALGGVVDYTVGPAGVKIFCLAEHADPKQRPLPQPLQDGRRAALRLHRPVSPRALRGAQRDRARGALGDRSGAAARRAGGGCVRGRQARPEVEETLDEYGMYMTYGEAVNADEMSEQRYLPEGLVEGCRLRRDSRRTSP
jgi:predicted homoserine dehydrogenase-like protein